MTLEQNTQRVVDFIKSELTLDTKRTLLSTDNNFPIKFENELGSWSIDADGKATINMANEQENNLIRLNINDVI